MDIYSTRDRLGKTQSDLSQARRMADTLTKKQKESAAQLASRLGQLQQEQTKALGALGSISSDVSGVKSDVSGVKQDVDFTKEQLATTRNDLRRVVGDMGVQSDLIAHNGQEIAELRLLGERNYYEFDLSKKGE